MADATIKPAGNSPVPGQTGSAPSVAGLAAASAAKNPPKPAPKPAAPVNKGGRRTVEEEARGWLASKGLRAVPAADVPGAPIVAEPPPPLDPRFVKDASRALVESYSEARTEWVESALAGMGMPKETVEKVLGLARIKAGNANTVVECSPAVLESMGVDSRKFPLAVFVIAALFDSLQFVSCLGMLKRLRNEASPVSRPAPAPRPAAPPPAHATGTPTA
jgi:hypothetical protein